MLKIAIIIWIVLGATLAGCGLTIVLATPALADQAMKLIPWASLAGLCPRHADLLADRIESLGPPRTLKQAVRDGSTPSDLVSAKR